MCEDIFFGNSTHESYVEEYSELFYLMQDFICIIETIIDEKKYREDDSYEGVCGLFAKSIIDYGKASIDNLFLGHFHVSNMVNRTILENFVCLKVIKEHEELGVWKYWIVYSYYNAHRKFGKKGVPSDLQELFDDVVEQYDIEKDFLKFAINKQYGWAYKVNPRMKFTFKGLCKLADYKYYKDFTYESDYSHGTSFFQKKAPYLLFGSVESVLSILFTYMLFFAELYCEDMLTSEYFECREIIYDYFESLLHRE